MNFANSICISWNALANAANIASMHFLSENSVPGMWIVILFHRVISALSYFGLAAF